MVQRRVAASRIMKVAITGATGFIGRALVTRLDALGHECVVLTRSPERAAQVGLPAGIRIAPVDELPAVEAVIHLAGENIAGLWTPMKRHRIYASRVAGTRKLVAAIRAASKPPQILLAASAVGIYGHRPGEQLDETAASDPCERFRQRVCVAWEREAAGARDTGCRVVTLRFGNVMARDGGFLGGLLPFYRTCGGFVFGNPGAAFSWISREDAVGLIAFALECSHLAGPINVVAPHATTQRTLARSLAPRVGRCVRGCLPAWLLRGVLGEFSCTLLDEQNVGPAQALAAGFRFNQPAWRSCLDWLDFNPDNVSRIVA
jgi:uncharacterized protein